MAPIEEDPPRSPASPKSAPVTDDTVTLQVQQFLDDWHYRFMHTSLAKRWNRTKVVRCGLDLLAMSGIPLSPEEISALSAMPEELMIADLVKKMPVPVRENFEHLAMQLQMLVTTAARIRKSADEGLEQPIQKLVEETDGTGIGQEILKKAVVQASKEVSELHQCQDTWSRSMNKRLDRLLRSAELAEDAQRQLIQVEAQLESFGASQNSKSKKALMGLAESSDKALIQSSFNAWLGLAKKGKAEGAIHEKFQQKIADAERKLMEYKERQLRTVKSVLMRQARQGDDGLLMEALQTWHKEVQDLKKDGDTKEALEQIQGKLSSFNSKHMMNTKRVMARMSDDQDASLLVVVFGALLKFSADYKKDKDFEDAVKKSEGLWQSHMKKKKDEARSVLDRMTGATDSGLLQQVVQNWQQVIAEAKKVGAIESEMNRQGDRFKSLKARQKANASGVQGRINEQQNANLLLRVTAAWQIEAKVNHVDKYYTDKLQGKRRQLQSVMTLFSRFAKQLEEGLGNLDGDSSGRTMSRRSKQSMMKHDGTVSLPDIHARQGTVA